MGFKFNSEEEKLALTADDKEIYELLPNDSSPLYSMAAIDNMPLNLCSGFGNIRPLNNEQPDTLPVTFNNLQKFIDCLRSNIAFRRYWSVFWINGKLDPAKDFKHGDDFHRVTVIGSLELSIRPFPGDDGPKRLHIHTADAHDCAVLAQNAVLNTDANVSIAAVMGRGLAMNPQDKLGILKEQSRPQVAFEWKIAVATDDLLARRLQSWRCGACGGRKKYYSRERDYLIFLTHHGLMDPREGKRQSQKSMSENEGRTNRETHIPVSIQPSPGPQQTMYQQGKRPNLQMDSQEFGPSLKRRSTGSQTWGSSSQSSFSSPESSRPPSVTGPAQYIMGPPPPGSIERPMLQPRSRRGSRGSWGSIGSGTARVSSGMAGLTLRSPSWDSPEGVAPPPEGAPWGVPQGTAGSSFAQPGGGYGQHSQNYMPQNPAYGQQTEVYGHRGQDPQGPPVRPFQVGITHTQIPGGQWPPRQALPHGQRSIEQPPVPYSHPPGQQAGFTQWQPGPEVQGGGGYPPAYPPSQPGRGTHFPQQSQHMAAVPPMGGTHPSILQNMPLTESPQLQDLAAASIPSNWPPNAPPPILQSLSPPAVSSINPSQFQAATTRPSVGQSYPYSLPPTTQSTRSQPLLYSGGQDNGRFYQSPPPIQQSQAGDEDPFWGASDSDED